MKRILLFLILFVSRATGLADDKLAKAFMQVFPEAKIVESEGGLLMPKFNLPCGFSVTVFVERLQQKFGDGVKLASPNIYDFPHEVIAKNFEYFKFVVNGRNLIGTISRSSKDSEFLITFVTVRPEIDTNMELPQ